MFSMTKREALTARVGAAGLDGVQDCGAEIRRGSAVVILSMTAAVGVIPAVLSSRPLAVLPEMLRDPEADTFLPSSEWISVGGCPSCVRSGHRIFFLLVSAVFSCGKVPRFCLPLPLDVCCFWPPRPYLPPHELLTYYCFCSLG